MLSISVNWEKYAVTCGGSLSLICCALPLSPTAATFNVVVNPVIWLLFRPARRAARSALDLMLKGAALGVTLAIAFLQVLPAYHGCPVDPYTPNDSQCYALSNVNPLATTVSHT